MRPDFRPLSKIYDRESKLKGFLGSLFFSPQTFFFSLINVNLCECFNVKKKKRSVIVIIISFFFIF